jgi:hypothetical protein
MKKIKLFFKEMGNALTNILCPLISIVIALMELFQLPTSWIQTVKKVEHWAWYLSGTKDDIDKILDEVEEIVEELEGEEECE